MNNNMTKYEQAVAEYKAHGYMNPSHKDIVQLADLINKPGNKVQHIIK